MRRWRVVLFAVLAMLLAAELALASTQQSAPEGETMWTRWDADHYMLLDDGELLWIGTGSGLVRYEKAKDASTRFSTADGLPHQRVFAGAVDGEGNRWFGGDGGLSRLDASGTWTHFDISNSGMVEDSVSAIAVTESGELWLGHPRQARLSRRRADGRWLRYPNAEAAVSVAYETVRQTSNQNSLWTVAGDEVWVGYDVFDGVSWHDRRPQRSYLSPLQVAADSKGQIWALEGESVYRWAGQQWHTFAYQCDGCFVSGLYALAVDAQDNVWVGGTDAYPYCSEHVALGRLPAEPGSFRLDREVTGAPAPLSLMLATAEGVWATGPNWLWTASQKLRLFAEVPFCDRVGQVIVDGQETMWVHSSCSDGVLQTLDDQGTGTTQDDRGEIVDRITTLTAFEVALNGDLWVAYDECERVCWGRDPRRYFQGEALDFERPVTYYSYVRDIFVEDEQRTWFVHMPAGSQGDSAKAGLWLLDDGGTPADFSDDTWQTIEIEQDGQFGHVAARGGRLWYGDESGVYRYGEQGWEVLSNKPVYGLIPARKGILIVDTEGDPLIIEAKGTERQLSIRDLVIEETELVRSTRRRNELWRIAPDGAIWYWDAPGLLGRWDGQTLQTSRSPVGAGFIEVDAANHVWLASQEQWADRDLWRLSRRPGFELDAGAATWFVKTGESRAFAVTPRPYEGYTSLVRLAVEGLPSGSTAVFDRQEIEVGQSAVLTLTTSGVKPGESTITIHGRADDAEDHVEVSVAIVEQVGESWLPIVR